MPSEPIVSMAAAFGAVALAALAIAGALGDQGARWRQRFGAEVGGGLRESFVHLDVGRLFRLELGALAAVAAAGTWLTGQPVAVVLAMVAVGAVPSLGILVLRRRRLARLDAQLPDAVMLVAGALRAGSSLPQAISQAARESPSPTGRELDLVVREQRLGVGLDASMARLERRVPLDGVTLFAAAVRIAQDTGGNLAETLERLADTLRRKAAIEGRIDALTAQGRLQGWVMAALPLLVGAALFTIEPLAMRPLLTTWQGWAVCALILLLEGLGLYFIRRIVDIDV
jgi:tight adherence protein B